MQNTAAPELDFLNLETYRLRQLYVLARATERQAEAELESLCGLRLPECRIIAIVACAGPLHFKLLATYAQLDKGRASRLIAGLVKMGAIVHEADPKDQRTSILQLTAEGRRLFLHIEEVAARHNALWLSTLPKAECAALKAVLAMLNRAGVFPALPDLAPPFVRSQRAE